MLKKFANIVFLLIFVTTISFFLTGCKDKTTDDLEEIIKRDKIIFGVKVDTKPFGFLENGEHKGIDIDIARYITKAILGDERKAQFVVVDSSNRLLTLSSGDVDLVIASMSITPQRRMIINFSQPYHIAGQTVLVPKESNIKSLTDLNNRRIVIVFGSTAEKSLRQIAPSCIIVGTKSYNKAFEMLDARVVDGMAADDTILSAYSNEKYRILNKKYTIEPYAIGYRKTDESERLGDKINSILDEMKSNGTLRQIEKTWLK